MFQLVFVLICRGETSLIYKGSDGTPRLRKYGRYHSDPSSSSGTSSDEESDHIIQTDILLDNREDDDAVLTAAARRPSEESDCSQLSQSTDERYSQELLFQYRSDS